MPLFLNRRSTGSRFYEWPLPEPNRMQIRSAVKPFEKKWKKPFPLGIALLMFISGVVGLIGLFLTILE